MTSRPSFYRTLATVLCTGLLSVNTPSCGETIRTSIKEGLFGFISGSVGNAGLSGQLNDFVFNALTGGFTGTPNTR